MKLRLEKRLTELKTEFESGQKALAELEGREANIRAILQRISGAIQVLEEELAKAGESGHADDHKSAPADPPGIRQTVEIDQNNDKKIKAV